MNKELLWFQQSFEQNDVVTYNVRYTQGQGPDALVFGRDRVATNTELTANAAKRGRTTWDERDIVEVHGTRYAEVIVLATPPAVPQSETPTPAE